MLDKIVYDGVNSRTYGIYASDYGIYKHAKRRYKMTEISGRNGDLSHSDDSFENVTIKYQCVIGNGFESNYLTFMNELNKRVGYKKLTDGFITDYYRKAILSDVSNPKNFNGGASFEISFDCKPCLYLTSGDVALTLSDSGTIVNPTGQPTRPLIRVYGNGSIQIGNITVTVSEGAVSYIDIDCETMNAYEGDTNMNSFVSFSGEPIIGEGNTGITLDGVTKVEITPRWYIVI